MPAPSIFTTIVTGLKTAADIAKTLRDPALNLERAETKFKIAELLEVLADLKISTVELQEVLQAKEKEIARLTDAIDMKAEVMKSGDAYFRKSSDGKPMGDAFCLHCWESGRNVYHLVREKNSTGFHLLCPTCRMNFVWVDITWPQS